MSKDKITDEKIYNLEVRFVNKDKSNCFKYPHRVKFYENDCCSADIVMPDIWFEHKDLDKYVADLEAKLAESENAKNNLDLLLKTERSIAKLDRIKHSKCNHDRKRYKEQINQLKQQLAKKDLKIIELETKLNLKDKETNV